MSRGALLALSAFGFALSIGCDEKKEAPPPAPAAAPPAAPAAQPAPGGTAPGGAQPAGAPAAGGGTGSISGTVSLTGKAPAMEELKRTSDPFCAKTKMKDQAVVENPNHTLKYVLVRVNGAPPAEPPAEKAAINQTNCMYTPRVQGIVAGQTLAVKNGDPVLHNVHTYKGATTLFNQAQVPHTPDIEKKFSDNGAMLKFKCDVHQWMLGWVWVQNNPYFAVTGSDGSFEIKNVPAGTYQIESWQERMGTKKQQVTVAPGKPATVKFEYSGTETASN